MEPRIIKDEKQYQDYVDQVEELAASDPDADSPEGARLELLAKLVEDYERESIEFPRPDPIDALVFRMEQLELRQADIADYLGGKNRASEVLNRKRKLTLPMIRALHDNLSIPLELLVAEPEQKEIGTEPVSEDEIPISMLVRRGWGDATTSARQLLDRLQTPAGSPILFKSTRTFGISSRTNQTHVWLWLARVRELADADHETSKRFRREALDADFIRYVVRLSYMTNGPKLAKECLEDRGISLILEPHLPRTHLDGAAMLGHRGTPIIALTLRQNRVDNFWFTLVHELVHAWKHLSDSEWSVIVDENVEKQRDEDELEREANYWAGRLMISPAEWKRSEARRYPTMSSIHELANELQISPAIVAGRVRFERNDYRKFSKLVGYRQIRKHFPDVAWPEK
ncbi:MAG: ImmA/IrrE family metallo-endopeptidase [Cyanobacteria bacterium J06638_22]